MTPNPTDTLLATLPLRTCALAQAACTLVRSALPGSIEEIKLRTGRVNFSFGTGREHAICSLLISTTSVKLAFQHASALPDPTGLLEGNGRALRQVRLSVDDVNQPAPLLALLRSARQAHQIRIADAPPTTGMSYAALCRMAARLPAIERSTSYGTPALKVAGKLMVRLIENGAAIALKCNWEQRERLLAVNSHTFYVTPHYQAYPWVLIRLAHLEPESASAVLEMAWREVASDARAKPSAA